MRECTVCGLTFLTGEVCPGCGSQVHQQLYDEPGDNVVNLDDKGPLPGLDTFMDSASEVMPEATALDEIPNAPSTALPFGMGGDSVTMRSTLPFGVGSHSLSFESGEMPHEPPEEESEPDPSPPPTINIPSPLVPATIPSQSMPQPVAEHVPLPSPTQLPPVPDLVNPPPQPSLPPPPDFASEHLPQSPVHEEQNAGDDVVFHDFSQDSFATVVEVDLDALVEDAGSSEVFDPSAMEAAVEPELHPIKALPVAGLNDQSLEIAVQNGFASMGEADWDAAARSFHAVASSGRGGAAALNNYGLALLQRAIENFEVGDGAQSTLVEGQFEAAIFALRQAAQSEGQRSEILYNLGIALHRASWHEKALIVFDTLLQRDGPQTSVLNAKAVVLESQGMFEESKQLLRQAAITAPQDEIISANLGRLTPI